MVRIAVALTLVATLVLVHSSTVVNGQASCTFVGGFAMLRERVGEQKVGACLDDEHFNAENGNVEQRTSGGLLVWRTSDNVTAFTDGATTWMYSMNGLENRPNNERFAWETDPVPAARPVSSGPPVGTSSGAEAVPTAASSPTPAGTATPTLTPTRTPTPTLTPTKTPNPIDVKLTEKPDDADTGNEVHFVARTSAKKGICTLLVTYRDTAQVNYGNTDVDDGQCEWKYILPTTTKSGTAKAVVQVTTDKGTASVDDEFRVRKGKAVHSGDVNVPLELRDAPDDVTVGQEIKITIDTDAKKRVSCELVVSWPSAGAVNAGAKNPDGNGQCTWRMTVPSTIPKNGTATFQATVRKDSAARTVTREFDVRLR